MKERGILFSAPMVRALLAGSKTQTRRVLKNPDSSPVADGVAYWRRGEEDPTRWCGCDGLGSLGWVRCPYGEPGDRLWVRETWRPVQRATLDTPSFASPVRELAAQYRADLGAMYAEAFTWKPSIFMPRWASRITLEVTEVRVERVQDISEEDARAEGMPPDGLVDAKVNGKPAKVMYFDPRIAYAHLWNVINGKRPGCSWADNPWVWVVSFKVLP